VKRLIYPCLFLVAVILSPAAATSDMKLEVIPLKHRTVEEMIPILKPLIQPGGTITGMNNQLIIKSTTANLGEIKSVLDRLDSAPRKLMIQVKQGITNRSARTTHDISGRLSTNRAVVDLNNDSAKERGDGVIISGKDNKRNIIRYQGQNSEWRGSNSGSYRIRATEGYPAYIAVGRSIPIPNSSVYISPEGGVSVNDSTEYINAESGFYVLPRLQGDEVTLLVAPRLTRVAPGQVPILDVQDVETTARGQLGEWIELGSVDQLSGRHKNKTLSSTGKQSEEFRSVLIKVDEIK